MNSQKRFINCCILLILLALSASPALSQDGAGPDSRLYNGHEYIRNGIHAVGFPFLLSDSLQPGTLVYDGILYPNLPMQYDLVLDELIIRDYTGKALISLIPNKIGHFLIGDHSFRYIPETPLASSLPKAGFYEELCGRDSVALFAHREKKLVFPARPEDPVRYEQRSYYFLRIGSAYTPVDGESSLLAPLKDKKPTLKKYIRDNNIRFKKDLEKALVSTTAYYLKLTN
ncbi:hypothetical protein [Puia sp.]|jgi:hypothetical protein|uniref:hypothetical protein n=1 Tax=Puia sp. TaxID=2045100 RepID=UPI002F3F465A